MPDFDRHFDPPDDAPAPCRHRFDAFTLMFLEAMDGVLESEAAIFTSDKEARLIAEELADLVSYGALCDECAEGEKADREIARRLGK